MAANKVFDQDDADEGGRPVGDNSHKVFEAQEEVVSGLDGDGDHDGRNNNGVDVSRNTRENWCDCLEVQGDGVHCASNVAEQSEG
ncbi:hypothetical protein HYQ46_006334 [Verticillium longisporum]|nr:hypothetical protein HYQ46_006334 [Verticillium longisporum]